MFFLRKELSLLGINPDSANLPPQLAEIAKAIAIDNRFNWPYVGLDFGTTRKGKHYFLEANMPASIVYSVVEGSNQDMDQLELQNLLLRNIARSRRR